MDESPGQVLQVISGIDVGGAENHLLSLCRGLVERQFDVTVAYLKGDGELAPEFRAAGCDVVRIGIRRDADPLGLLRLTHHLVRTDYDIVHCHLFHANLYGVLASSLAGVPAVVASKHNDPPFWETEPYRTVHGLLLRRVDQVFPISNSVERHLLETTPVAEDKVQTIRYGLDTAPFKAAVDDGETVRREFGAEKLVGTVSRLTEQKGIDTLIRAFQQVRQRHDAHLVIVGRGELRDELEALTVRLGLTESVTFTGFREDVPALMQAFDVFALPSRWEGLGVVFMEAQAAGTPVVASDTSAIPEVVAHGETGYLCPPDDVGAFADAISELLADETLRRRMGDAGTARIESEFTVDRMVNQMADAYRTALDRSR